MAHTPAYWTYKKCQPSLQVVSQLSLSQALRYSQLWRSLSQHPSFPNAFKLLDKNRQAMQAIIITAEISDNIICCLNIIILTVKVDMSTNLEPEPELC